MQGEIAEIITKTLVIPGIDMVIEYNPATLIMTWLAIFIILALVMILRRRLGALPNKSQMLLEFIVGWFDNILRQSMGKDGRKFLPLVLSLFLFVLICNWLNIVPGLESPTRDLNTCLGLGILVFFVCHISAIIHKGFKNYISGYFKPFWFLFPSNIFSEFSKVISHSFRLFGNIFAGGIVISIIPIILLQLFKWWGIGINLALMPVLSAFFGIFIGAIQAFVFSMLAVAYITVLRE